MRTTMRTVMVFLMVLAVPMTGICAPAKERSGSVTFSITLDSPQQAQNVKMWFPYPTSDLNQKIENLHFDGNYATFTLSREPQSGALYLYTEWRGPQKERHLNVTFDATAQERKVSRLVERPAPIPAEVAKYVKSEFWIPSDDKKVKALSHRITAGKKGILNKSRAVYDWVVDNTKRDPKVPGCGVGNVQATLAARSGKCADISTLFVALARASGVPAREVFGLRLGRPGQTDISNGHHCWAEFYLPGTGWVPVDPADVSKAVLEKNLSVAAAKPYREYYFGAVDEFRIVLQKGGRGIVFTEGNKEKVNYFMYPYAEVDGKSLDYCRPDTFAYTVKFRER
ncbi:transglutaminase domain-containing protein [Geomonas subterranea]|uniref:transglutaminase-like domain-containing protein n=1 Tax=Geomonas subterranea TaxID=2847989 RepID=UPI001C45F208|nr:transglutaminase domain-containing protein [Geomonas subterranea]QXM08798.1 transglutaminase domain-containing protein [Geomonas subterranea]